MRSTKEILARAIIVDTTSQRSQLEEEGGYGCATVAEQEEIRRRMCALLKTNGYDVYMTEGEKAFMDTPARQARWEQTCSFSFQAEGIRPLLWAIGLVDGLLGYDGFDMEYYDDILMIGAMDHNTESILSLCKPRTEQEIFAQCEIAMMWHWRAIEARGEKPWKRNIEEVLTRIFGEEYRPLLQTMSKSKGRYADFLVRGKPVSQLKGRMRDDLELIAGWRQHAFEWLLREDEDWDEITADT